jgi:hypothetical protein
MKAGYRPTGEPPHLQRALDALAVARRQARGGQRVDARQLGVQRRPALGAACASSCARTLASAGGMSSRPSQRLEVQHGAAHQQRRAPARADVGDQARGVAHELAAL